MSVEAVSYGNADDCHGPSVWSDGFTSQPTQRTCSINSEVPQRSLMKIDPAISSAVVQMLDKGCPFAYSSHLATPVQADQLSY